MKQSILSEMRFHSEEAAYEYVEAILWPGGPVCPHCGATERIGKMGGKSHQNRHLQVLCMPKAVSLSRSELSLRILIFRFASGSRRYHLDQLVQEGHKL